MNLKENIKRLKKERGWSKTQLAEKVGCHLSNITRIETGKYVPALETVAKIAKILDVPIDYLVNSADGNREEICIEDKHSQKDSNCSIPLMMKKGLSLIK